MERTWHWWLTEEEACFSGSNLVIRRSGRPFSTQFLEQMTKYRSAGKKEEIEQKESDESRGRLSSSRLISPFPGETITETRGRDFFRAYAFTSPSLNAPARAGAPRIQWAISIWEGPFHAVRARRKHCQGSLETPGIDKRGGGQKVEAARGSPGIWLIELPAGKSPCWKNFRARWQGDEQVCGDGVRKIIVFNVLERSFFLTAIRLSLSVAVGHLTKKRHDEESQQLKWSPKRNIKRKGDRES